MNTEPANGAKPHDRVKVVLIVCTILFGIAGLAGCIPAMMSPMMFDSPGSDQNPATLLAFYTIVSFPLLCAFSIVSSWVFYAFSYYRSAWIVALVPLLNVFLVAIAVGWLMLSYDGNFGTQSVRGSEMGAIRGNTGK